MIFCLDREFSEDEGIFFRAFDQNIQMVLYEIFLQDTVGEPVIRRKLFELFEEKTERTSRREDRIRELKKELKELESQR